MKPLHWLPQSIFNSYAQIFFSNNRFFAVLLMLVTFLDPYMGITGIFAILSTNLLAYYVGFNPAKISKGLYGFNSLLVGLGMSYYFEFSWLLFLLVLLASVLNLFISVSLEGVVGKYDLPYLSLPFMITFWIVLLSAREFGALSLSERGIYIINELYSLGGQPLVDLYQKWKEIPFPPALSDYFRSLSAIFFMDNTLAGMIIALGILIYSRIGFSLSLLGFYTAFLFYYLIGADLGHMNYGLIGFNYILTAIAVGGFFVIPHRSSYLWTLFLIPMVAMVTISLNALFYIFGLPIYALPFNLIVLLFIYILKFRLNNRIRLQTLFTQRNSPEKNLYFTHNYNKRFSKATGFPIHLPFHGEWTVTQGHDGPHTHRDRWKHAWDYEIKDQQGKTYRGSGNSVTDYHCYGKPVLCPADGVIQEVLDDIPDNRIGERNLDQNWGNAILIKHTEYLYSQLGHLSPGSIEVKVGDAVKKGAVLGKCGNSGNSPYPHLHFQLQANPHIGSDTLSYCISNYLLRNGDRHLLVSSDIPRCDDIISNIVPDPELSKAFHFIPGETIEFLVQGGKKSTNRWVVKRDDYLNKYIECEDTGAKAWYFEDGSILHFIHFEGNKKSPLYLFFLGAYKICLGKYPNLAITDHIATNLIFKKRALVFQDFIAPFWIYRTGRFQATLVGGGDPLSNESIQLSTTANACLFSRVTQSYAFHLDIKEGRICSFEATYGKHHKRVLCSEKF